MRQPSLTTLVFYYLLGALLGAILTLTLIAPWGIELLDMYWDWVIE